MSTPHQLKLPKRLENDYDRKILMRFREWEKMERKTAAFRNHLHFSLHCKHHGVFPPSLTLKCVSTSTTAKRILQRAQKALLNERITSIKSQLQRFEGIRAEANEFLFLHLPFDLYQEVCQWTAQVQRTNFDNIRKRQCNKFTRLMNKNDRSKPTDELIVHRASGINIRIPSIQRP